VGIERLFKTCPFVTLLAGYERGRGGMRGRSVRAGNKTANERLRGYGHQGMNYFARFTRYSWPVILSFPSFSFSFSCLPLARCYLASDPPDVARTAERERVMIDRKANAASKRAIKIPRSIDRDNGANAARRCSGDSAIPSRRRFLSARTR